MATRLTTPVSDLLEPLPGEVTRALLDVAPGEVGLNVDELPPSVEVGFGGRSFHAVGIFAFVGFALVVADVGAEGGASFGTRSHPTTCFFGDEEKYEEGLFLRPFL